MVSFNIVHNRTVLECQMEKFPTLYLETIIKRKYRLVLTGNYADVYSFYMGLFYSLCTVMYMISIIL